MLYFLIHVLYCITTASCNNGDFQSSRGQYRLACLYIRRYFVSSELLIDGNFVCYLASGANVELVFSVESRNGGAEAPIMC